MPFPKLFKNKGRLRQESSSTKQISSRHQMDAILSREFVPGIKSRAKSPTDLLDMVGYPRISNASSPDLVLPSDSSSSQKRQRQQQRPSVGPRRASFHSYSPTTNNPFSSSRTIVPKLSSSSSTSLQPQEEQQPQLAPPPPPPPPPPLPRHQLFQHQHHHHRKQARVGVTIYDDPLHHKHAPPARSSSPTLIMPTPKMAVPLTEQMLINSNNPWADKTLDEEDQTAGYPRDDEPLSRASTSYELLVPPPPPPAPVPQPELRHRQRSHSEISVLYDKLRSYRQEQEAWAQREKVHRIREERILKKLHETRSQLEQLQIIAYQQQNEKQQQQSQQTQPQPQPIIDEAFCDEPSETSDIENEADRQLTNQNHATWRHYRVPETYYNEEEGHDEDDNYSYYSNEDNDNKSSGYVSEEEDDDEEDEEEEQNEFRGEMTQQRRRYYMQQRHHPFHHRHNRHHHSHSAAAAAAAAAGYYYYHSLPIDHIRPWSAVYRQQQQQQLMENRPPHFYYYHGYQPGPPPTQQQLFRRRSRKSSDTSVHSVPVLRHSNSTTSSSGNRGATTNITLPRNTIPPIQQEFSGDNFYSWNPTSRTAYL
ncbi:hypothetical protein BDA99DRAFT_495607 [Phascolomyces articulosus]|uniref:Uncharacterized protein n=1 Tax=Phascolomyces articulosus TaxID=60185 RepID=A0AAD5K9P3_9FUNG|nr:hypothetical protein BDA99DRAFT_495607 [Phascolomyces articulosus]